MQLQMMINLLLAVKCRLSPCGRPEQMNDDRMDAPRRSQRLLNKGGPDNFIYWASSNSSSFTAILVYIWPSSGPQNPCEIIGKNVVFILKTLQWPVRKQLDHHPQVTAPQCHNCFIRLTYFFKVSKLGNLTTL